MARRKQKRHYTQTSSMESEENPTSPALVKPAGEPVPHSEWIEIPPMEEWASFPLAAGMLQTGVKQWNYLVGEAEKLVGRIRQMHIASWDDEIPLPDAWEMRDDSMDLWLEYQRLIELLYKGCPAYLKWFEARAKREKEVVETRLRIIWEEDEEDLEMVIRQALLDDQVYFIGKALDVAVAADDREAERLHRKRWYEENLPGGRRRPAEEEVNEMIPF